MTERQLDLTNYKSLEASPCSAGRCYGNVRAVACVWAPKKIVKALDRCGAKKKQNKKTIIIIIFYLLLFKRL